MAQSDPTVLNAATRFTAKSARSVSVSPSRSPIRKAQFKAHEVDPLLGSLSPDSTLKALSETNAVATAGEQTQDILTQSISEATEQERALGIRAAIAGKKIKEWYTELADWEWPTGLDVGKGKGFENPPGQQDEDYLGCLPVRLLEHYEERVEEIKDGLEALEVEDLKEHVLDAHIPTRSRPTSASGVGAPPPLSFVQLSDFTAVITATIVQALPYLAHLSSMLQTWDFRFLVLRLVPGLLKSLNSTKKALQMAWHSVEDNEEAKSFNRTHFESTKSSLECMVSALGSTFDKALDALEGREDSLPEEWIDLMDSIEMDFANWVVVADKRSFLNEMNQNTLQEAHILVSQCTEIPPGDTPSLANPDDGVEDSIPPQKGECYPNSDLGPGINQDNTNTTETTEYQLETVADAAVKSSVLFEPASNNGSEASVNTSVNINEEPHINEEPNFIKEPNMAEELEPPQAAETMASNLPELTPLTSFRFPPSRAYSKSSSDPRRPEALQIPVSRIGHRRDVSEISVADSMMSDAFSDLSNAEILNASTAEVSSPTIVESFPRRFSSADLLSLSQRQPPAEESRPRTMHLFSHEAAVVAQAISDQKVTSNDSSNGVPGIGRLSQGNNGPLADEQRRERMSLEEDIRHSMIHRASVSSMELISKSRVRSIMISRSDSNSSVRLLSDEGPQSPFSDKGSPTDALRALSRDCDGPNSPLQDQCDPSRPSQETTISTNGPFEVQKAYVPQSPVPVQSLGNLSAHAPERPPLLPRKSSRRLPRTLDVALGSVAPDSVTPSTEIATNFTAFPALTTPTKATPASPLTPQSSTKKPVESPTKSTDETIEEKIQDILSGIPARIRLKSPSQPEPSKMPDPNRSSKGSCEKAWLAPIAPSDSSTDPSTRSTTPTPSLTLTPVRPSRSSRPSVSRVDNSDVKVYHLSRSGPNQPKDTPPIRLFVRLVGESGERVMVRVGGGWADLGEYLREYALHHGHSKSSMTNDQFEVQALPDNRKASDGTALGSSPAGSGYLSKSYGTPKQPGSRPSSALDVSRPTPPGLNNHKTRRASAASATIRRDAESPSAMFSSSPASTFSVDPIALDTDKLPPVPIVPSQHDHSRRSFSSAGPVRSATPSQLASSPAMPKFTPLGAAGPVKTKYSNRLRVSSATNPRSSSPIPSRSPSSRPTTASSSVAPSTPAWSDLGQVDTQTSNDAWVQDVLKKARRSHVPSSPPAASPLSGTPAASRKTSLGPASAVAVSADTSEEGRNIPREGGMLNSENHKKSRSKSRDRLSQALGVGGDRPESPNSSSIRRVFLRKKNSFR